MSEKPSNLSPKAPDLERRPASRLGARLFEALLPRDGKKRNSLIAVTLLALAILLRISGAMDDTLWVDEAESSINGLTILETGLPKGTYLGQPIYENTLTEPLDDDPEYAFRDSSYSKERDTVVYHGWLPLYAIAGAQALCGIEPQSQPSNPASGPVYSVEDIPKRTLAPRIPAIVFSAVTCVTLYFLLLRASGYAAALASLTWYALAGKIAWFGTQARYYSMTLMMNSLVTFAFFRVVKKGSWSCFALFGIAEGLLFHTHQLSAVVFATVSLTGAPFIIRHQHWILKSALAIALAAILTIPWALWTGFFHTASTVPSAFRLFNGIDGWLLYSFQRPKSLLLILAISILAGFLILKPRYLPQICRDAFYEYRFYYLFLLLWMAVTYGAFHTLVPAASYFTDRITLMLVMPFILLNGILIGDLTKMITRNRRGPTATVISFITILVLHRPYSFYGFGLDLDRLPLTRLFRYMEEKSFPQDTRFYATPSNQLIYTYYTGIPIQSTAPIRKSFFDNYEGTIVIFNARIFPCYLNEETILGDAKEAGATLSSREIKAVQKNIWTTMTYHFDKERAWPMPEDAPELTPFEARLLGRAKSFCAETERLELEKLRPYPIFQKVEATTQDDYWTIFFVRFTDYPNRIGENTNFLSRIRRGHVDYIDYANIVCYISPGLE